MSTYQVFVNQGSLSNKQKQDVAQVITECHSELTGTPKYCIQVIIHEVPDENRFVCGRQTNRLLWIDADLRPHTPEKSGELMRSLAERVAGVSNFYPEDIWIDLNENEPTNVMRYQEVFCPAGEEEGWFDTLSDTAKETIRRTTVDL